MSKERIRVCDLARELHVSSRELVQTAHHIGINVIRAAAQLTASQEARLRDAVTNDLDVRRRSAERRATTQAIQVARAERLQAEAQRSAVCSCCGFRFMFTPLRESGEVCSECRSHFERMGESFVQTIVRHEEHVVQAKQMVERYRLSASKLSRERDEAYRKRDKWMAALVEIVVAHGPVDYDDGCVCGAPEFPCVTRRHLRQVNRGIYDRCEELEAMNEEQFNRVLYGSDLSFFSTWDDSTEVS